MSGYEKVEVPPRTAGIGRNAPHGSRYRYELTRLLAGDQRFAARGSPATPR